MIAHLLESTAFALIAGLLTLALKHNSAAVRHNIWLAASLKFLIPFSLLTGLGANLPHKTAPIATSPTYSVVIEHFTEAHTAAADVSERTPLWPLWLLGSTVVLIRWRTRWRTVAIALKEATPLPDIDGTKAYASKTILEPGAFGILRPVLLLPQGIAERLSETQLNAIIAHELCHIRRKDNLAAALHMLVEAAFWFHPLVWWIGTRLVDERERACDEDVIRLGSEPQTYAESILKVCEFCLQSPLSCMSGVTGSDLRKRVERIVSPPAISPLGRIKTLALYTLGLTAIAGPILIGIVNAPPLQAQSQDPHTPLPSFEVASIKPSKPEFRGGHGVSLLPGGGITVASTPLIILVQVAWHIQDYQLSGASGWMESEAYDISAKPAHQADNSETRLMMRSMLIDRFHLVIHRETKELPVYALVTAKSGPRLEAAKGPATDDDGGFRWGGGHLYGKRVPVTDVADVLSGIMGRPVIDKTGLTGLYDLKLEWTPANYKPAPANTAQPSNERPPNPDGPSIFTAIQEQLGLKLDSQKGPVDTIVIDSAQRPSAN